MQKYELALVVDVEGIGEEVLALLITARYQPPGLRSASVPESPGRRPLQEAAGLRTEPAALVLLPQEGGAQGSDGKALTQQTHLWWKSEQGWVCFAVRRRIVLSALAV